MHVDANGDAKPIDVPFSPGAKAAFVTYYDQSQQEQAAEGEERVQATLAKLRGGTARLAMIIHLMSIADGARGAMPGQIDEASMNAGIGLARWFADEARRLFEVSGESQDERRVRALLELVRKMGGRVTERDLRQQRRIYKKDPDLANADLQRLVDCRHGRWENPAPGPQGGRPSRVFVLTVHETADGDAAADV
jgi:hypothetical protein